MTRKNGWGWFPLVAAATLLPASGAGATVLFDNGGIVTHPGQGAGGADVSMASANLDSAGTNVFAPSNFRQAEDFVVPASGWVVDTIRVYAYQTNSTTISPFTAVNLRILDTAPNAGGVNTLATGTAILGTAWTGTYRTFHGGLLETQRPVMYVDVDLGGLALAGGTYWFDFSLGGGTGAFVPPVMTVDGDGNPVTVAGNALQFSPISNAWQPSFGASTALPFQVLGTGAVVPEPSSMVLTGLGLLVLLAVGCRWPGGRVIPGSRGRPGAAR